MRALLIGDAPDCPLGYELVHEKPYDAVVIGSLRLGQLLRFSEEEALSALARGKPVFLYTQGLPQAPDNRALSAAIASARRELKNWGVIFADGNPKRLITAQQARELRASGKRPGAGAVLTPLAKEILEGME